MLMVLTLIAMFFLGNASGWLLHSLADEAGSRDALHDYINRRTKWDAPFPPDHPINTMSTKEYAAWFAGEYTPERDNE